jgi:hypothetical protein
MIDFVKIEPIIIDKAENIENKIAEITEVSLLIVMRQKIAILKCSGRISM